MKDFAIFMDRITGGFINVKREPTEDTMDVDDDYADPIYSPNGMNRITGEFEAQYEGQRPEGFW